MGKRKVIFFCLAVGLFLTVVVWAVFRDREQEPMYNGRTLSEWADFSSQDWEESSKAIRHMGTNMFPVILKWLRSEQAPWERKIYLWLRALPSWTTPRFLFLWLVDRPAAVRVDRAFQVFGVLQQDAAPMAPELLRLSYQESSVVSPRALAALGVMGKAGLPYLLRGINDPSHPYRERAILEIGRVLKYNPEGTNVVPALIECMWYKPAGVQQATSVALAYWASKQPEGAAIDDFKKSVGNTNEVFQQVIKRLEMRRTNHVTNNSLTP